MDERWSNIGERLAVEARRLDGFGRRGGHGLELGQPKLEKAKAKFRSRLIRLREINLLSELEFRRLLPRE